MAGLNVSSKQFKRILQRNGFTYSRSHGSHSIFRNEVTKETVSVPERLNPIIAERLVKEFHLDINA